VNVVVRVGDTVRRPPEPSGVRALTTVQRAVLLDELVAQREGRLRRAAWRLTVRDAVLANLRWLARHRAELARALT
jgi:hypothetical protein